MKDGIALAESWGLRVKLGEGIGRKRFQQAGTPEERAADLRTAIDDPDVRAIWCARGGYGTVQLMEHLDLSDLRRDPKWVVGFSDATVLHNALHNMGLCSLHAQMPHNIGAKTEETKNTLREALFGNAFEVRGPGSTIVNAPHPEPRTSNLRAGTCERERSSAATSHCSTACAALLTTSIHGARSFLEDLDELLYHVDRMIMNLKLSGWFNGLAGLVVEGMADMHDKNQDDPFGQSAEEDHHRSRKKLGLPGLLQLPRGAHRR